MFTSRGHVRQIK